MEKLYNLTEMKKNLILLFCGIAFFGCADMTGNGIRGPEYVPTPTVDYVRGMDPYDAANKDPFLSQLSMNYRSFAIFNAERAGFPDIGEMFAQKAVSAFSGETPMPESLDNWNISDNNLRFELSGACQELLNVLGNDAAEEKPKLAAEAQAKFDCWLAASASGQGATAAECRKRFENTMLAISGNGGILEDNKVTESVPVAEPTSGFEEFDGRVDTAEFNMLTETKRTREGVVILNNINVPGDLIRPAPVNPVVFNQNFYGAGGAVVANGEAEEVPVGEEVVSRDEFINMMMSLRNEIQEIQKRLDNMPKGGEPSVAHIKVQQIPLEPKQRVMEEIFEVRFDFNKSKIRPEYESVVKQLALAARQNKNVKISIVGHTDTVGGTDYNFALGGRRAEAVKKMLIEQGVPANSMIVVSSGKNDLKVPTGPNVKNADNRRVRVVKEVRFLEPSPKMDVVVETPEIKKPKPLAE